MNDHGECGCLLARKLADMGCDAYVTVRPDHDTACAWWATQTCPHGITFWLHPTLTQRQQWARDKVE